MRTRWIARWGVLCLIAATFVGCSREQSSKKNINVAENIKALQSDAPGARADAAIALAEAGEKAAEAVPALIAALKDKDPLVRRLSAYALGEIGPKASQAIVPLKEALADQNREVIFAVANALKKVDPKSADIKLENVSGQ